MMDKRKSQWALFSIIFLIISLVLLSTVIPRPSDGSVVKTTVRVKPAASGNVRILDTQGTEASIRYPYFLDQIHFDAMKQDWDRHTPPIIVAIVDTGIDLNHPDLRSFLVPGINLLHRELPPNDDNGHGTSVAGVLRSIVAKQDRTRAFIMPIKSLDANGIGSLEKLDGGIRYAVDHGAKIVILSNGVYQYLPDTLKAVEYAEEHDVLIVAATGNEGKAVKYPAAYPTVLAVGGASKTGVVEGKSNWGPEVDVIAPWFVYTTAMGGGYRFSEGTSMAAPQAAGVAALLWSKYPKMKAYQIRDFIRQTADHVAPDGWDPHSGYGLIRADQALTQPYIEDMFTNNTTQSSAAPLSYSKNMDSAFHGEEPKWFYLDVPYDGTVTFTFQSDQQDASLFRLFRVDSSGASSETEYRLGGQKAEVPVLKGRNYIKLQAIDNGNKVTPFHLTTQFQMYADPFGDSSRMYKAYVLPLGNQEVTGTFGHEAKDWFLIPVTQSGILHLSVTTDTPRIDLGMQIEKENEKPIYIDQMGEGDPESATLRVFPGNYYVKIQNVISAHPYPVTGEYTFRVDFTPKLLDQNGPNEHPYEALNVVLNSDYPGVLDSESPVHWYSFQVKERSRSHIRLTNISAGQQVALELFNHELRPLEVKQNSGDSSIQVDRELTPGTYYVKLSLIQGGDPDQLFQFRVDTGKGKD